MASIYYSTHGFGGTHPAGMLSSGDHRVARARLVWAAATMGTTPFGPRLREGRALEMQWRSAMIRASIEPGRQYHRRSSRYERLDPSEKGAVSFFLAQAQAKLFAHDFSRVSRFTHYDSYLSYIKQPRAKIRPDFIGFYGQRIAIGVEAKGRSGGFPASLVTKAKKQARSLPAIRGHHAYATYAHVAYFDQYDDWCAYLEDPPTIRGGEPVDPAVLTTAYYQPIVNAIRTPQSEPESLEQAEGSYLRRYFPDVDLHLSVRADIAASTPEDNDTESIVSQSGPLYELVLGLDERPQETWLESDERFLGRDGVAVELGPSWREWTSSTVSETAD